MEPADTVCIKLSIKLLYSNEPALAATEGASKLTAALVMLVSDKICTVSPSNNATPV